MTPLLNPVEEIVCVIAVCVVLGYVCIRLLGTLDLILDEMEERGRYHH